ncbi:hypothetical protein JM946_21340 [Steroidobacter sp. S1-65]|uniref:Uncharacterized protein n=1 Tax=Steroidobacter gossypii TaxID=2805490 RepID=A0ABS1X237_9GAMM|nr:hypothetical protein [Steroidobacter gossypii]MBM0107290.1 hypothetical protein [Steroidobacter gossypii]
MRLRLVILLCGGLLTPLASGADDNPEAIQATWKEQELRHLFTVVERGVAYECLSLGQRLKEMLIDLGAHQSTQVRVQGCSGGASSELMFTIATATPVPLAEAPPRSERSEKVLKRMRVNAEQLDETFPAAWRSVELSRYAKLGAGDCELMRDLRNNLLPKLGAKIESGQIDCRRTDGRLSSRDLTVSVLAPLEAPDVPSP